MPNTPEALLMRLDEIAQAVAETGLSKSHPQFPDCPFRRASGDTRRN